MQDWYDIYKERMNSRYLEHVRTKYAPLIQAIIDPAAKYYFEVGCGAGNITRHVRDWVRGESARFYMIDICPRMLSLAMENNPDDRCYFQRADITKLKPREESYRRDKAVVHSHGVLEHFSDKQIIDIISSAADLADTQVHYVPSNKYDAPSRGDERLMSPQQWFRILQRASLGNGLPKVNVFEFNGGKDLILHLGR